MNWILSGLKWLSQLLIIGGGLSALFQEKMLVAVNGRRKLTRTGWAHVTALLVGFMLFGATEVSEQRKALTERMAANAQAQAQAQTIGSLNDLLKAQGEIKTHQDEQLVDSRKLVAAEETVIRNQASQNSRLKNILLASYEISGLQVTLQLPNSVWQRVERLSENRPKLTPSDNEPPEMAYFATCLKHGLVVARRTNTGNWEVQCYLSRDQGIKRPLYSVRPGTWQWTMFDTFLETLLTKQFAIQLEGAEDLIRVTKETPPSEIAPARSGVTLTFHEPHIKLSQLMNAKVSLRADSQELIGNPITARLLSLDPSVKLDQTFSGKWELREHGTQQKETEPFEPEVERPEPVLLATPLQVAMAGPFQLKVRLDSRFLQQD